MFFKYFVHFVVLFILNSVIISETKSLSQKPGDFWDETEPFGQSGPPSPDLRLPPHIVPSFYRLKLKTDLENSTFTGDIFITIKSSKNVKEIILHSKNLSINSNAKLTEQIYEKIQLYKARGKREVNDSQIETSPETNVTNAINITNVTTTEPSNITTDEAIKTKPTTEGPLTANVETHVTRSTVRNIKIASITQASGDRLILTLASALKPNVDYILELSFGGNISNSMMGFYKSAYTNSNNEIKELGVTQFEPISARAAFPCFDEPAFKAKFEISIAHPQNLTALSNMKVAGQENFPDNSTWQWTHFDRSVEMSTYLVAYIVSDFKSVQTSYVSKDNVTKPITIWTRPELLAKANYALSITPKLLEFYEDVFGVPYALDKLDLVAIPDFSSGAMENWGLITFRETTLLFDEKTAVPRDKQNVAIDIAHELAHQWFGNLVTMRWWTDLWLNEGFATYIEYVGVDHVEPEWNMFETFTHDKMDLLRSDALKNTSPVSRRVVDATEISQKFDEISYNKGATLIRMLNHTISEQMFQKGLLIYLNNWKYSNAEENDLWEAMAKATKSDPNLKDLSLVKFMNSWTRQPGYPVVNVIRNYETGEVKFEQNLFTTAKDPYKSMMKQLWHIPISYGSLSTPDNEWTTKPKIWLTEKSLTADLALNATQAFYVNVDAIGYYRVNYDKTNWKLLTEALKSGKIKSPIKKAQLIDDAFNLAKTSRLNYSDALGLTTCVINGEDSRIVWEMLLNNMGFLRHQLRSTSGYRYFQDYMRKILSKQLEKLNYGLDKPKDDNEAFLIENLVMWECYVESPRCINWAKTEFDKWAANPDLENNTIDSYLRSLVYNMALRHGGRREFDLLYAAFRNSTDPNVKTVIINNLPSTRDEALVALLLERSLSEIPKQYAVAAWAVDGAGSRVAQRFLLQRFDEIYERFTAIDAFTFPAVLSGAFGFVADEDELNKLKSFAMQHKEKLKPMSQTLQKLVDSATFRINWVKRHLADIIQWFEDYAKDNSTNTTSVPEPTQSLTENITIHLPSTTPLTNDNTQT